MNKIVNIKLKYLLIFLVVFLLVLAPHFMPSDVPETSTEKTSTSTTQIIEKKDSISLDVSTKISKETIAYLVDSISNVYRVKPTVQESLTVHQPKKAREKEVTANVYKEDIFLDNGKAKIKVVSTGKVLGIDLSFLTNDKIVTNTTKTTVTKYIVPNAWFVNVEPKFTVFPSPAIVGGAVSIDYTIKNRFRIGAGVEFNTLLPINSQFIFNAKIGFKL